MPPDYATDTKPTALQILDDVSLAEVRKYYGKSPGYDAKSQLLRDLGLPATYVAALADGVNEILARYPGSGRVTGSGLRNCNTIGDFITLFSKAARATIPPGEPK